jgi:hypothetical protein
MPPRVLAGLLLVLACSPPAAPQAQPQPAAEPPPASPPEPAKTDAKPPEPTKRVYTMEELDAIGPRPAPVPPLTQEEIDLIAADPKELTKEMRVKQAYARRRKTLQNPDSPLSRQLEALRLAHQRGELPPPQLPSHSAPNQSIEPSEPTKAP